MGPGQHFALYMVVQLRFEGHEVSLPELGSDEAGAYSGKQGLNIEIL